MGERQWRTAPLWGGETVLLAAVGRKGQQLKQRNCQPGWYNNAAAVHGLGRHIDRVQLVIFDGLTSLLCPLGHPGALSSAFLLTFIPSLATRNRPTTGDTRVTLSTLKEFWGISLLPSQITWLTRVRPHLQTLQSFVLRLVQPLVSEYNNSLSRCGTCSGSFVTP